MEKLSEMSDSEVVRQHYMALSSLAEGAPPEGSKHRDQFIEAWSTLRDAALAEIYKRKLGIKRLDIRLHE